MPDKPFSFTALTISFSFYVNTSYHETFSFSSGIRRQLIDCHSMTIISLADLVYLTNNNNNNNNFEIEIEQKNSIEDMKKEEKKKKFPRA